MKTNKGEAELLGVIILVIIIILVLDKCTSNSNTAEAPQKVPEKGSIVLFYQDPNNYSNRIYIFTDKETNQEYFIGSDGHGMSYMTPRIK